MTQTPEEIEYTKQQIELAKQQLALTQEMHGWQSDIFNITKPLLEKYALLVDQDFAKQSSPEYQALQAKYGQLEEAQLDQQIRNLPLQDEMLQLQLDEIRRGGRATDEQKALIGEIANRALESGQSDISAFLNQGLTDIRNKLAPARGMRPDDAPIIDAGEDLAMEALRQQGNLVSDIRGAQANAELNFPLNASQLTNQYSQWQQNFNAGMNQYLSGLKQQAYANRAQFMGQLYQAPNSSFESGIGLINASRPTAVSFPRNTTETTKTSGGSILGGIGGILSGIGSVGSLFSTEKAKENIRPIEAPAGHLLSPGALKTNITPVGGPQRVSPPTQAPNIFVQGRQLPQMNAGQMAQPKSDEDMLQRISELPVSTWNYKAETGLPASQHIGPMAEDFATKVMGTAPQQTINAVDAIGSLMSSVKALERRTRQMKNPMLTMRRAA